MHVSASELHLRRARDISNPSAAISEYMKAIEQAVREMKSARPPSRSFRWK
jgi:hypothetical protein